MLVFLVLPEAYYTTPQIYYNARMYRNSLKGIYLKFFLGGQSLNSVSDIFECELRIESIGPVLILLHQIAQVPRLYIQWN